MTLPFGVVEMPGSASAISSLLQKLMTPQQPMPGPGVTPSGPAGGPGGAPGGGPAGPGTVSMGGVTMPAPQAAPMPQITAPKQPSMIDRVHDWLQHNVQGNAPGGYDALLSPDEIKNARPSLLSSLVGTPDAPNPQDRYRGNLEHIVRMKQIAAQTMEQQRVRKAIATMPKLDDNATLDQFTGWARKAYAHAVANDLPDEIKSRFANIVQESIKAPKPDVTKVLGPGSALVGPDGKVLATTDAVAKAPLPGTPEWKAAEEFKAKLAAQYRVEPTQILQGQGDDGEAHFFVVPKHGGPPVPIEGMSPKITVKSESAQQELTRARAQASVSEMNNADSLMTDVETRLANGTLKIGNVGQILGSMANTFTHDDPASKIIQNSALSALNKANPDLARYIRRALSFAEGESGISARPSDFRTRMAAFLSQAANGASPEMIQDIGSRRRVILNTLNRIYPEAAAEGTGKAPPTSAPAKPVAKPTALAAPDRRTMYDAARKHLAAQGKSTKEILATIGARP